MTHHSPLIGTIVVGLVLAFIFGALAQRLRISPLVGYLVARAHSDAGIAHLRNHGASLVIMGEQEVARAMLDHATGRRDGVELTQPGLTGIAWNLSRTGWRRSVHR